jgi:hypothetical protein
MGRGGEVVVVVAEEEEEEEEEGACEKTPDPYPKARSVSGNSSTIDDRSSDDASTPLPVVIADDDEAAAEEDDDDDADEGEVLVAVVAVLVSAACATASVPGLCFVQDSSFTGIPSYVSFSPLFLCLPTWLHSHSSFLLITPYKIYFHGSNE